MKFQRAIFLLVSCCMTFQFYAQDELPELTSKDSIVTSAWIFELGINIVDDSGRIFNDFTPLSERWNYVPYPSRVAIGRYFPSGLELQVIGTYNQYMEGNVIDGEVITEDIPYWGLDSRLSYDLNKIFGETGFFDPYLGVGLGYTDANRVGRGTYNAVVGFRLWFSDRWGLDLNSSGKWSFGNEATNHLQHAAGVAYRFGIEKGLSKKGQEKLAMITEMEEALQREQDSLQAVREAEERARQLAAQRAEEERLANERRLAQEREMRAEKMRDSLRQALEAIGPVRFAFDSSYLTGETKDVLKKAASFMQENPNLIFRIEAHADSRGDKKYNQWLSERRAQRVVDFLVSEGVSADRIEGIGYGEEKLLNHCADGVRCSAAEHAVNRRSQMLITVFN